MKLKNKTILITSNEAWGDMWFSKQHYAYELSKLGYEVYFINPPPKWKIKHLFGIKLNISKEKEHLYILSHTNPFPKRVFEKFVTTINDSLLEKRILKAIKTTDVIWWKFDCFRFLKTNSGFSIYHVVDDYTKKWQDKYLGKNADLIVCISSIAYKIYEKIYNKVILCPHSISGDEKIINPKEVERINIKYGKFLIFVGSIHDKLDFDLIKEIVDRGYTLLVLGKETKTNITKWEYLKKRNNLVYLGEIHAKKLKNYIKASSLCLLVYNNRFYKESFASSLKIINYTAQYKKVITTIKIELFNNKGVYYAASKEEYLSLIEKAFNDKLYIDKEEIDHYLNNHSYKISINSIVEYLFQKN
jgi:hypothetical protein